jgi:hypothetical protein
MTVKELLIEYRWIVGGVVVLTYVVKELISYNRLRHFKGPPGAAISNWWHTKAFLSGRCHEYYGEANEQYGELRILPCLTQARLRGSCSSQGPIVRIAPNILMTSSPELWTKINNVRSNYKRSNWFYRAARIEPHRDNVFSQTNDELHNARRKQMTAGVSLASCIHVFLEPSH